MRLGIRHACWPLHHYAAKFTSQLIWESPHESFILKPALVSDARPAFLWMARILSPNALEGQQHALDARVLAHSPNHHFGLIVANQFLVLISDGSHWQRKSEKLASLLEN